MAIERRSDLHVEEFVSRYLANNAPVIVTDAISRWPAPFDWSTTHLSERFGDRPVQVYDSLFDLQTVCELREYLQEHCASSRAGERVPYVRWYAKFRDVDFVWADEAFSELAFAWRLPYFLPSSDYLLPKCSPPASISPVDAAFPAKGIFISGAGAYTRMHRDPWGSDAVLCQLLGRKIVTLLAPWRANELTADGELPDLRSSPVALSSHDHEDVLEPGEVLFIPSGWLHHVETLTHSVSLTWNFVHAAHAAAFQTFLRTPHSAAESSMLNYFGYR